MSIRILRSGPKLVLFAGLGIAVSAWAGDIGQIKISKGHVSVERGEQTIPGAIGMRLQPTDIVRTGADGSVGITMSDDSLLAAGPNSSFSLNRFVFDPTTNKGQFEMSLRTGSLVVSSGRIAKESHDAMTVRTRLSTLGVRGTRFVVESND